MAEGDGQEVGWLDDFVEVIRQLHDSIIRESGGVLGERTALLYSAAARPFQSAFGEFVFDTPQSKAAALFQAIIRDHPFGDGNKRTASVVTMSFLTAFAGYPSLEQPPSPLQVRLLGEVALETASAKLSVEQIAHWIDRIFAP